MEPEHPEDERRHGERIVLDKPVSLALSAGGHNRKCRVANVSMGGTCIDDADLVEGEPVVLDHPDAGRFTGTCVWCADGRAGIAFDPPKTELERALQCIDLALGSDPRP